MKGKKGLLFCRNLGRETLARKVLAGTDLTFCLSLSVVSMLHTINRVPFCLSSNNEQADYLYIKLLYMYIILLCVLACCFSRRIDPPLWIS